MKKFQIVHVTRFFEKKKFGGIEEVIKQISSNGNKYKFEHIVLCTGKNKSKYRYNNHLKVYKFKSTVKILSDIFSITLLKKLIKFNNERTIFHIHYPHFIGLFYLLFLKRKNLKVVVTHHSDILKYTFFKKIIMFCNYIFFNRLISRYHISTNTYLKNSEIHRYKFKSIVEPFSLKKKNNLIKSKKKKYVLFISRFSHYKGFEYLEEIIQRLSSVNFICVTNYKFRNKFKNIKILSDISQKKKDNLITNSRILISTSDSRAESFGMTMLEGLYLNKPLICFDIDSGIKELVINNYNGYVIKKFSISDFCKKILKIYNDNHLYTQMSKNSKKHKKKFNSQYQKLYRVYNSLVD
jgi:glycosyltransferase involved in cell wall biosynthesis